MSGSKSTKRAPMPKARRQAISDAHAQRRVVSEYLTWLDAPRPRRSPDQIRRRLDELVAQGPPEGVLDRVLWTQQRLDLEAALAECDETDNSDEIVERFVAVAAEFSERTGVSYAAWREVGVPPSVLSEAGIARTRRTTPVA